MACRTAVGFCIALAAGAGASAAAPAPAPAVAPWDVIVAPNARIFIRKEGALVAECSYVFWGQAWKYVSSKFEAQKMGAGATRITGEVTALGLKYAGDVTSPTPDALRIEFRVEMTKDLDDIMGGGLDWRCMADSPVFARRPPDPALLGGNAGWKWPVAPGEDLTVRFEGPLAYAGFDGNQKTKIRTLFAGSKIRRGTHSFAMTVQLPPGGRVTPPTEDRYGPADTRDWYRDALRWDASPVDLGDLNAGEKPAGRRGFVAAKGDQFVFADGTPARFWGGNIAAYALFCDKKQVATQARRISRLGYNLMRLHHHDSRWVSPIVIDTSRKDSRHLDPAALDRVDWWIKCLKDEGVYVWLDLHVGRNFKAEDGISLGYDEIRKAGMEGKGFNYLNPRVEELMREFNAQYLGHVNPYTKLAYKDEPAVMGMLITNENDMTHHGHFALPDKNNPAHGALYMKASKDFAAASGLPAGKTWQSWLPGPSKSFLNDVEHRFNRTMLADLKRLGVRVPVATTNFWGNNPLYSLPALAEGDVIDVHSYGYAESLSVNPRYEPNFLSWIASGQVAGKPLTITEWNVPYPQVDRFTAPLYLAGVACLQGWDAPMIYNYSQGGFGKPGREDTWSTSFDPGITATMPAAAVAFRRGHVRPARETFCLDLGADRVFEAWSPTNSATIRTLAEKSRLVIGLPDVKEFSWDRRAAAPPGATVITDPNRDFIGPGKTSVESDTGELKRDWEQGVQTIDTPKTQAALGWVGGRAIRLKDVTFRIGTNKAAVSVTSLDELPIASSRKLLITAVARAFASPGGKTPMLSEPVAGEVEIRDASLGLELVSLDAEGRETPEPTARQLGAAWTLRLPSTKGTHWFLLREKSAPPRPRAEARKPAR